MTLIQLGWKLAQKNLIVCRRPFYWKLEDDKNVRWQKWKTTKMEDNINGICNVTLLWCIYFYQNIPPNIWGLCTIICWDVTILFPRKIRLFKTKYQDVNAFSMRQQICQMIFSAFTTPSSVYLLLYNYIISWFVWIETSTNVQ